VHHLPNIFLLPKYILIYLSWIYKRPNFFLCRNIPFNPLNAALNPICHILSLLGSNHILHISSVRTCIWIYILGTVNFSTKHRFLLCLGSVYDSSHGIITVIEYGTSQQNKKTMHWKQNGILRVLATEVSQIFKSAIITRFMFCQSEIIRKYRHVVANVNCITILYLSFRASQVYNTRWFKYDRDWLVCKQAALRSSCATLKEWSHNLHPPSCSG